MPSSISLTAGKHGHDEGQHPLLFAGLVKGQPTVTHSHGCSASSFMHGGDKTHVGDMGRT